MKVFNLQLITNLTMKAKRLSLKLSTSAKSIPESSLEDTFQTTVDCQKVKNYLNRIDTTVAASSQNQISTGFLIKKVSRKIQSEDSSYEFTQNQQSQRKLYKNKKIQKKKFLRSDSKKGKFGKILRSSSAKKIKEQINKTAKYYKKLKRFPKKEKIIMVKPKSQPPKEKEIKLVKKEQKGIKFNFDQFAQIKIIGFDRKQLQKKRQDLLKRVVEDWSFNDRGRSEKRQLRSLNI